MYSRPFFSERRVYGSLFARVVALIDEISTKRIHIEEQIRGNVLSTSTCLRSQWFISHLVVLIIFETGDKCPNESRRIIPFVASVPFLFLPGKYALKNSSIVCLSCAAFYIFGILCLWKLTYVQKCMQWRKWRNWRKITSLWRFELDAKSGPLEAGDIQKVARYSNWMPKVAPSN